MNRSLVATTLIGLSLCVTAPSVSAMTRSVDCDKGQTIQAAIEKSESRAERLEIFVSGICNEDVVIRRSELTIEGGSTATIKGRVSVFADDVWLYNLTVTAPGGGVTVGSGNARLWSVALVGNQGEGLLLRRNSSAWVRDSTITDNEGSGISVEASQIDVQNTSVSRNGSHGIVLAFNSQASITGSTINENYANGIELTAGSQANVYNSYVQSNIGDGIVGYLGAIVVLHGNDVTSNGGSGVVGNAHSTVQIGGAHISDNAGDGITMMLGSKLILEEPATELFNNQNFPLWCGDGESSVSDLGLLTWTGNVECTGF